MDKAQRIKELRERTGMNRKEFCEYFRIPYRTVSEWERDGRHAPEYVIRLLEYYIRIERIHKGSLPLQDHLYQEENEDGEESSERDDTCERI